MSTRFFTTVTPDAIWLANYGILLSRGPTQPPRGSKVIQPPTAHGKFQALHHHISRRNCETELAIETPDVPAGAPFSIVRTLERTEGARFASVTQTAPVIPISAIHTAGIRSSPDGPERTFPGPVPPLMRNRELCSQSYSRVHCRVSP